MRQPGWTARWGEAYCVGHVTSGCHSPRPEGNMDDAMLPIELAEQRLATTDRERRKA
jgi:hypothetical protein